MIYVYMIYVYIVILPKTNIASVVSGMGAICIYPPNQSRLVQSIIEVYELRFH